LKHVVSVAVVEDVPEPVDWLVLVSLVSDPVCVDKVVLDSVMVETQTSRAGEGKHQSSLRPGERSQSSKITSLVRPTGSVMPPVTPVTLMRGVTMTFQ
jgi:hypothetical protein